MHCYGHCQCKTGLPPCWACWACCAGKARTKIPAEAWAELAEISAGEVLLAELQICSMQGRKAGEFYR